MNIYQIFASDSTNELCLDSYCTVYGMRRVIDLNNLLVVCTENFYPYVAVNPEFSIDLEQAAGYGDMRQP